MSDTSMEGMHHDPVSMPEGNGFGAESVAYVLVRWAQFVALLMTIGAVSFHTFVLASIRRDPASAAQPGESAMLPGVESRAAQVGHVAAMVLAATLRARLAALSYAMHGARQPFDPALVIPMLGRTMWGWGWLLQLVGVVLAGVGFHRARARQVVASSAGVPGPPHL